jgi:RNA recognition motif-containing protein
VAVDRVTGFPRGFAHADFTDVESATKALEKLSGFEFNGRNLRVDYAGSDQRQRGDNKGRRGQRDNRRDNRQSSEIRE